MAWGGGVWRIDPPYPPAQRKLVPITVVADNPPVRSLAVLLAVVGMAWPQDNRSLERPNAERVKIAPLTLTYGDQPPPFTLPNFSTIERQWEIDWKAQQPPKIAPLTLVYGDQPPRKRPLSVTDTATLLKAWEVAWGAQGPPKIAPLTLVYGDDPPRLRAPWFESVSRQWQVGWDSQHPAPTAAWNVPTATVNDPPGIKPGVPPWVLSQWQVAWNAQSASPNAGWNTAAPVVSATVPFTRIPWEVLRQWDVPWHRPPVPAKHVPSSVVVTKKKGLYDRQFRWVLLEKPEQVISVTPVVRAPGPIPVPQKPSKQKAKKNRVMKAAVQRVAELSELVFPGSQPVRQGLTVWETWVVAGKQARAALRAHGEAVIAAENRVAIARAIALFQDLLDAEDM